MYKTFMALHNMVICKSSFLGPLWVPRYNHKWPEMVVERAKSNPELLCHSSHVCPQNHPLPCALLFYVQGHEQLVQGLSSKGGIATQGKTQCFLLEHQKHFLSFEIDAVTVPRGKLIFFLNKVISKEPSVPVEKCWLSHGKTRNKPKQKNSF